MSNDTLDTAFVIHTRRYGDTSLIVELFMREQGRMPCVVKGALRSKRSSIAAQPFQRVAAQVRGRGEMGTLTRIEALAAPVRLAGQRLYCGFYINELLMKLIARNDPYPALFDAYTETVAELDGNAHLEPLLRRFEFRLLKELGVGLTLNNDAQGSPIDPDGLYTYNSTNGAERAQGDRADVFRGKTLLDMHADRLDHPVSLREARALMRNVLDHHLGGRPLHSRELFRS